MAVCKCVIDLVIQKALMLFPQRRDDCEENVSAETQEKNILQPKLLFKLLFFTHWNGLTH